MRECVYVCMLMCTWLKTETGKKNYKNAIVNEKNLFESQIDDSVDWNGLTKRNAHTISRSQFKLDWSGNSTAYQKMFEKMCLSLWFEWKFWLINSINEFWLWWQLRSYQLSRTKSNTVFEWIDVYLCCIGHCHQNTMPLCKWLTN